MNLMNLIVTADEQQRAKFEVETAFAEKDRPLIGLVLGSSWQTKSWPYEKVATTN